MSKVTVTLSRHQTRLALIPILIELLLFVDLTVKEAWERKIDISQVHRPPFGNSDLALAELAEAVVLDSRAQPVKIATERLRVDDLVLHLGWGQAFQGAFPDTLLKVQLRVSEVDPSSDQTFTAVGATELGIPVDPCDGDSGGPLLYTLFIKSYPTPGGGVLR